MGRLGHCSIYSLGVRCLIGSGASACVAHHPRPTVETYAAFFTSMPRLVPRVAHGSSHGRYGVTRPIPYTNKHQHQLTRTSPRQQLQYPKHLDQRKQTDPYPGLGTDTRRNISRVSQRNQRQQHALRHSICLVGIMPCYQRARLAGDLLGC